MTQGPFYLLTPEEYAPYKAWRDSQPVWQDRIQENTPLWGFDGVSTMFGKVAVPPDDANGANLSLVSNPVNSEFGFCLRHYGDLSMPGSSVRAQAGVYGAWHPEINAAADQGCYFEHECYLPEALSANNDPLSWVSLQDIHVTDKNGTNRSYLAIKVKQDGSMRAYLTWGGPLYSINLNAGYQQPASIIPLPVGRWFRIRTYFKRSVEPTIVRVWFDDELALEWTAINSLPSNERTEYYLKLYGGVQGNNPWGRVERFLRNAQIKKL